MPRKNVVLVIALLIGLTLPACGGKTTPYAQATETQTARRVARFPDRVSVLTLDQPARTHS